MYVANIFHDDAMNTLIPFLCLGLGVLISWRGLPNTVLKSFNTLINIALIILMLVIGLNIGISPQVMNNLDRIGFNSAMLSIAAIFVSAFLVLLCEKTVLPLEGTQKQFTPNLSPENPPQENRFSPLIIIMPGCIVIGIIIGYFLFSDIPQSVLDWVLTISLILLYISVGVSLGENKSVFQYIKKLGLRLIILPVAIFAGSIIGGLIAGLILNVPLNYAVISASGMGYYSLTGATMTDYFGIEAGTYGFVVNVLRDVFSIILMPLLVKISKGSPIAAGAAGCMDTMLVPVTKAVGTELGVVALISGTILTFVVPVWLPISRVFFM